MIAVLPAKTVLSVLLPHWIIIKCCPSDDASCWKVIADVRETNITARRSWLHDSDAHTFIERRPRLAVASIVRAVEKLYQSSAIYAVEFGRYLPQIEL